MKSAYYAGLQSLSLALIFMPEPITTVVGVGLLGYARKNAGQQRPTGFRRLPNTLGDHYNYRMDIVRGTTIAVQLSPKRHGQLPRSHPQIAKLQDNPQALKALRERSQRQSQRSTTPFSKLEPAGLMKPPRIRDRAALVTPRHMPTHE